MTGNPYGKGMCLLAIVIMSLMGWGVVVGVIHVTQIFPMWLP